MGTHDPTTMDGPSNQPAVAIIGMAGRFPGAASVADLWRNLLDGVESITRFDPARVRNPGDAEQVNARGVLAGADLFDAGFFGITPREAELMDPQHRLLLECAWEALEDAGCDPGRFRGAIGVYAGQSFPTYLLANLSGDRSFLERLTCDYQVANYPTVLGNDKDYLATRISYKLGLSGPSMTLQTACSTSLVAVTQAVQALLSYQCDMALAGGVSVTFPQERGYHFQEGGMVSGDGHCRAFDADAQGTVFGSGAALVALKRLDEALADGDRIVAVIRGAALNNDGAQKVGFMAPSVERQAEVIALTHALAGVTADTIGYVEAHGTATPLGDPIEVEALTRAFRATTNASGYCLLGSVKTNLGHLEVASGVTGLIKAALAVQHGVVPASLHYRRPNPKIDFANTPFRVAATRSTWPTLPGPRRAGVSSFGVGGTNAHVVIEQAPAPTPVASDQPQILTLSARTPAALTAMRERLAGHLAANPGISLADVAWTLQSGRHVFSQRAMVMARDGATAVERLRAPGTATVCERDDAPVAFLFPGQGAQRPGMCAGLYRDEPRFRSAIDACCAALAEWCPDLRAVLFDPARSGDLIQTRYTQPALFATEYALAQVWLARGIRPSAMIGHSVGEYVAACLAEVMPLETAIRAVAIRGRLVQALPGGAMLAVRMAEADLAPYLRSSALSLAASNGPTACVVAGPEAAIAALEIDLTTRGIAARRLTTSHAFHSSMMDGMLDEFAGHLRGLSLKAPTIPFISGVSGTWITAEQATDPTYWVRHVREPVRFAAGIATLAVDARLVLLEVGPGRTLTNLAKQCLATGDGRMVIATQPDTGESVATNDLEQLAEATGRLWLAGVPAEWSAIHVRRPTRTALPTYPFERQRYWVAPPPIAAETTTTAVTQATMAVVAPTPAAPTTVTLQDRHGLLLEAVRTLISEQSGADHRATDPAISFIELGFDSLFLTQFALTLQQRFKVKVGFRHLLDELGTTERLARFLEQYADPSLLPTSAASPATSGGNPMLDQMQRQIAELARQMASLSTAGMAAAPSAAEAPAAQPATPGEFKAFGPYKPITRGPSGGLSERQQRWLDGFIMRYTARTKESKRQAQHHRQHLADPRVVAGFRQQWKEMVYPLVAVRSKGARLWDVDGNEYIDILNGFGSSLFGHSPDFVNAAVTTQLGAGIEVGPQTPLAGEVAKLVTEFTGLERATFCNTGSEAVMAAMRLARTVTGRSLIVSFQGDYHGTFDEVLVRPNHRGKDLRSAPIAPGIPQGKVDNILILEYGSPQALEVIRERASELAAVLIEPVQSRHPDLQPAEFLHEVRRITTASGTAMIMDEVITGFRVHPRGAQGVFGVQADLATYGKVIGGGHPLGVLAGNSRFMDALDGGQWRYGDESFPEVGVTFFAGTFVRHPLAMAAAKACLLHLKEQGPALQETLNRRTQRLADGLNGLFQRFGVPSAVQRFGSVFYFAFAPEHRLLSLLHYLLRAKGVHIWEGFPCFLTTAHGDAEVAAVLTATEDCLRELTDGGFLPITGDSGTITASASTGPAAGSAVTKVQTSVSSGSATPATAPATDDSSSIVTPLADQLPLTDVQRELWVASQLSPEASVAFNDGILLHLDGPLEVTRLRQALELVIRRHPALLSCFESDGSTQRFLTSVKLELPLVDLSNGGDTTTRFENHRASVSGAPFDLGKAPLLRASLVRLGADRHVLILLAHHLVCDGWSFAVVINELGQAYSALGTGIAPVWPPAIPYHAYAQWQAKRHEGSEGREALTYWRNRFRQLPPDLDLPLDHPRRPSRTFRGATERVIVEPTLYAQVQQGCARQGTTVFSGMLAMFAALMTRLTHQEDLVIGIPAAGQSLMGVDRLAGHCVHFLPLRLGITPDQPLAKVMRSVRDAVLDAYEHPDITYGRLLESLTLVRDPSRPPLLSVLFNLDRAGFKELGFRGLHTTVELNAKSGVVFDLDFNLMETDQGVMLCCHYNRDLFEPSTIARWLQHLLTITSNGFSDPQKAVGDLAVLSDAERHLMLEQWNATTRPYPRELTIHRMLAQQAAETPEAIALVCGEERLTYRALDRLAARLATQILARCAAPNAPIAICLPRTTALPVALLAVLKAGACYVPLDARYPEQRIAQILEDARPSLVITQSSEWAPFSRNRLPTLMLDGEWERTLPDGVVPPTAGSADDIAYVLFTSGSTGRPKGVQVPHRTVVNLLHSMRDRPGIGPGDTLLAITTLSFDIHVTELLLPLSVGARVVLADREVVADTARLVSLLDASRPTVFQATPVTMRMLIEAGWKGDGRLRLWCGGEAFPRDLAEALLSRAGELWNGYGPTETTVYSSLDRIERGTGPVLMGTPVANTRLHVLDQRRQPVPIGVPGEIYIGGEGLALGYLGLPEQTKERFVPDLFRTDEQARLYRTGDIGRYLIDGRIEFLGRTDHQVKIRGFRIELGDIENALGRHTAVRQRVVVAHRPPSSEATLVAYVSVERGSGVGVAELRRHLRGLLPEYMVPTAIVILDELPLTPNGKVDRKALPAPDAVPIVGTAEENHPTPTISLHFQLLQLWEEILNTRGVRLDDDFFAIGGNSLLAFRMMTGIERLIGRRLPMAALFANPTIAGLSTTIMEGNRDAERPLLEVQAGSTSTRPFFFLHGDYLGGGYYCVSLARRIGAEVPFYALVPRHLDPHQRPPTIEQLAAEHIRHIREVSPTGPYLIGGFCIGGVIAFEIARQLTAQGHRVGLLALIDAETGYPAERWALRLTRLQALLARTPPAQQLAAFTRFNQQLERLREVGPFGLVTHLLRRIGLWRKPEPAHPQGQMSSRLHTVKSSSAAAQEQMTAYLWAACSYKPRHLDLPAHLLASDEQAAISRDPTIGWGRLLRGVEVKRLNGNHLESITRNLPQIAMLLRPLIDQATAGDKPPLSAPHTVVPATKPT